jgi:hypothetical protein
MGLAHAAHGQGATDLFASVKADFENIVRPLVKSACGTCHSTEKREGELDLERFRNLDDVRQHPAVWQHAAEMVSTDEMPPKDADRALSKDERRQLLDWIERYLTAEARASAGDPGPVVLRRLSNAEYTYTLRDLTGVELDPAREFPGDAAAGEGFTNTGAALVMSPALLEKYLDAAKDIARHAVLLPAGIRFSSHITRSDWTNEILERIRTLYRKYSASVGATQVNLQGIVFDTNDGGRLPVEKYLAATFTLRDRQQEAASFEHILQSVTGNAQLSPKYLQLLWDQLSNEPAGAQESLLISDLRARWRAAAPSDIPGLVAVISTWQASLNSFQNVGHMKPWMTPVDPVTVQSSLRFKVPAPSSEGSQIHLVTTSAGDGVDDDVAVWRRPRLLYPDRPEIPFKDLGRFYSAMRERRTKLVASTAKALRAADEAMQLAQLDLDLLAQKHQVDRDTLVLWFDYLGIAASGSELKLDLIGGKLERVGGHEFVRGWGWPETPSIVANASPDLVRIPGRLKGGGVCVHPSPTLNIAIGWKSPIAGEASLRAEFTHAHPECGNGVAWAVELRRGTSRQQLAAGVVSGANPAIPELPTVSLQVGDLVSVIVGPRDANHSCDLTDVEFTISTREADPRVWSLTQQVAPNLLSANPLADSTGHPNVWHFYTEPVGGVPVGQPQLAGSLLARWHSTKADRNAIADQLQSLLAGPAAPTSDTSADAQLYRQLMPITSPLFLRAWTEELSRLSNGGPADAAVGLDPSNFGRPVGDLAVDPTDLAVAAPSTLAVRIPVELADTAEFAADVTIHPDAGEQASVQAQVTVDPAADGNALLPGVPVLAAESSVARKRFVRTFSEFRSLFPAALCYTKIVPVDEVITLVLFHREDEPLVRLMLSDEEARALDHDWQELRFVSQDAFKLVDAFQQLLEFASQDSNPALFEPYRATIEQGAEQLRDALRRAEPTHVDALVQLADRIYRRPLSSTERDDVRSLYAQLRTDGLAHEDAIQFTLARLLVSPTFLYHLETPPSGTSVGPVSDRELANRLSYFLWSSLPDDELVRLADEGTLRQPAVLSAQVQRMMHDPRIGRLASEFACQWLHIYDFQALDEKSERHFPEFLSLRADMHQEVVRFFTDLFQSDRPVVDVFNADYTFVNSRLAEFYGLPDRPGDGWQRVDDVGRLGRGGILGFAATLAKQSGASRTSPILRGTWISEVLLGEKLPKPPPGVPVLPEDESATAQLTVRELVERHSSDERCAKCHRRVDPFGFALEGFDTIGRRRDKDLAGRPIDTQTVLPDGTPVASASDLRTYLVGQRREVIVRQFCKKLLGYSLGRSTQLSDEPLLDEIQARLAGGEGRISTVIDTIAQSRPFQTIRGRDSTTPSTNVPSKGL